MIVNAAFEVARKSGVQNITARIVAEKIGCSTQPVMYCFSTIDELKRAVYKKADAFHSEYLMNLDSDKPPVLSIGLNYIRFAVRETNLFRLLFQSDYAAGNSIAEMIDSEELIPVISAMREAMGLNEEQTKQAFLTVAVFTHGYASLIAESSVIFDEQTAARHLETAFKGAVLAAQNQEI